MSADPNKKSPRTFQCRDVLWETFEQMANDFDCSIDYLVNEAMRAPDGTFFRIISTSDTESP